MSANPEITQDDIAKLLKGIKIPSPPQLIADLQMEMSMPDPDLNALSDLINKDVGLSGGILKTVNSSYYGKNDVSSISKSVMLLGMQTVMNIVNTLCLRNSMTEPSNTDDEKYKTLIKFWDSASDVAQCCQIIAKKIHFKQENKAYMIGLFHNAGIPLLMERYPNYPKIMKLSYAQNDRRIVDIENDELKTNHAVLSFYTARSWKLPEMLCNIISKHHNGLAVLENQSNKLTSDERTLTAILFLAQHIAGLYRILGNQDNDLEWEKIGKNTIEYLGLSEFDYEDLISFANDQGIGVQSYFI
jgi:HD-like signal output (HDOD) protein